MRNINLAENFQVAGDVIFSRVINDIVNPNNDIQLILLLNYEI